MYLQCVVTIMTEDEILVRDYVYSIRGKMDLQSVRELVRGLPKSTARDLALIELNEEIRSGSYIRS